MDRKEAFTKFRSDNDAKLQSLVNDFNSREKEIIEFALMYKQLLADGYSVRPTGTSISIDEATYIPGVADDGVVFIRDLTAVDPNRPDLGCVSWNSERKSFVFSGDLDIPAGYPQVKQFIDDFNEFKIVALRGIDQIIGYDDRPQHAL